MPAKVSQSMYFRAEIGALACYQRSAKRSSHATNISARIVSTGIILEISPVGRFGGVFLLAEVRVQEGEPLENALRRFKRKVQTEDIIKEVKRHSFYLKPGEKRRVKEALARKRNRKKVRKEQD